MNIMRLMKHRVCSIIIIFLTFLLSGCDKLPANGYLDGLWQITSIEQGGVKTEMKSKKLYCSFQLKLFMLGTWSFPRQFFGYFERNGDTIRFYSFTYRSDYIIGGKGDELMTDEKDLDVIAPWGFYSTDCMYNISTLNSSELILEHGSTKITYRKL